MLAGSSSHWTTRTSWWTSLTTESSTSQRISSSRSLRRGGTVTSNSITTLSTVGAMSRLEKKKLNVDNEKIFIVFQWLLSSNLVWSDLFQNASCAVGGELQEVSFWYSIFYFNCLWRWTAFCLPKCVRQSSVPGMTIWFRDTSRRPLYQSRLPLRMVCWSRQVVRTLTSFPHLKSLYFW